MTSLGKDSLVLIDKYDNDNYQQYITSNIPADQILSISDIMSTTNIYDKKVIVVGTYTALLAYPYLNIDNILVISSDDTDTLLPKKIKVIYSDISKKANLTINILLNALNRNFELAHDCKVL